MLRGSQWTPAQTGKDGLFRLVSQAHELYKSEVSTSQKSYKRFALDFIYSKQYHDELDAWSKNEHQKNYKTIADLLTSHEKLVRKHFDAAVFNEETISILMSEFYSSDLPQVDSAVESGIFSEDQSNRTIEHTLDRDSIGLIVQLVNEVNLFHEKLDPDEVWSCFKEDRLTPVTCRHNTHLVLVLDRLASNGIISPNWQKIISVKHLIVSSGRKKYLDQHDISSPLSRAKNYTPSYASSILLATVDKYIRLIKSRKIKHRKE